MATYYVTNSEGRIVQSADWKFSDEALELEAQYQIVRDAKGQLHIAKTMEEAAKLQESTPKQSAASRIAAIHTRLKQIDHESVRPLRAITRGVGTEHDISKMASLETEADELRAELCELAARPGK